MSAELHADFEKRFPGGPRIAAELCQPVDGFSVTVLFGPSGSGKTTILRCLAGLERPECGHIRLGDTLWFEAGRTFLPPQRRDVGFCFQEYALFPHLSVAENIGYGLTADRSRRVAELVRRLDLGGFEGRYPRQLSGGQQQRVALARALARRPRLLLLDEPLAALDTPLRAQLRGELRRWLAEAQVPVLLVTHERAEAEALGDSVLIVHEGRICQRGAAAEVFARPATAAVARIVGFENVLPAAALALGETGSYLAVRAEDVQLNRPGTPAAADEVIVPARVVSVIPDGPLLRVELDCGFPLTALAPRRGTWRAGDAVQAQMRRGNVVLLSEK